MEFAGRTESIDKYRTAWRTFESCGELGAPFLRGVERGAPARRGAASLDSLDRGPIHYLHTVLAQRADAGLPTASAAAAVPAATSHRQVERFTRPGRSNFASRGPRTAVHCTGSGGIYTRLSRLAGCTATQQYVNTFILGDGGGLASTAATHTATTSSLELVAAPASGSARRRPRPRRVSFGSLVAIDAHRSRRIVPTSAGGTSESPWLITIFGPLVVVREATEKS